MGGKIQAQHGLTTDNIIIDALKKAGYDRESFLDMSPDDVYKIGKPAVKSVAGKDLRPWGKGGATSRGAGAPAGHEFDLRRQDIYNNPSWGEP